MPCFGDFTFVFGRILDQMLLGADSKGNKKHISLNIDDYRGKCTESTRNGKSLVMTGLIFF